MNKPVEFFFDFISPFGWFAAERIGGIVRAHGRNVAWKPLLLGVTVKQAMGLPAVLQTPLKGPYLLHDAERCARLYRLPWRPPTPITFSSVAAERAVVWAVARGDLDVEALVLGLYRCAWAEAGDISTPDAVADVAASIGFDRAALRAHRMPGDKCRLAKHRRRCGRARLFRLAIHHRRWRAILGRRPAADGRALAGITLVRRAARCLGANTP